MTTDPLPGDDVVAAGFETVADAFRGAVAAGPRGGAALAIQVDGTTVVDLCGGVGAAGRPWTRDTPTVMFSCSKGLLSLVVARLVEGGRLELDAPVAGLWPEFAQAGKETVTVRQVMAHQAGLSYPAEDLTVDDVLSWDPVVAALAAQAPWWAPGRGWSYHTLTFGWLVGEVIRRVTGRSVGTAFRDLIAGPLEAAAWFGIPPELLDRVPEVAPLTGFTAEMLRDLPTGEGILRSLTLGQAFPFGLVGPGVGLNDPRVRSAEVPGAGAIGTAAALAAIWSSAVVPTTATQPVAAAVVDDMTGRQTVGDPVVGIPGTPHPRWGTGFMIDSPGRPLLSPSSFGHDGAGGQLAFADRDARLGFAFLTSDMGALGDTRALDILDALRRAL